MVPEQHLRRDSICERTDRTPTSIVIDLLQKCSQNLEGDVAFDRLLQTVQLEFDWFHSAGLQLDGLPLGSLSTLQQNKPEGP